jgi:geranylgeranyl diphosphate synthase type I
LFGDPVELGKPIGSDLREGKKTPYYIGLIERMSPSEKKKLSTLRGKQDISGQDVTDVRRSIRQLGIEFHIQGQIAQLSSRVCQLINSAEGIRPAFRKTLLNLVEYNVNRTK